MRNFIILTLFIALTSNAGFASSHRASDIIKGIVYSNNDENFLVLHELVYHTTNKSYEKGNSRSVGYNEIRLSVYDLNTGRIIIQKEMGTLDKDNTIVLLGCIDDYILLYSSFDDKGMIALNIKTFDTKVFFSNYMINRDFGAKMLKTNWRSMYQHFGYNAFNNKIIFTDSLNNKYTTNLNKYNIEPSNYALKLNKRTDYFSSQTNLHANELSFNTGEKQCITINGTLAKPNHCFIDGYYLMEHNYAQQFNFLYNEKETLSSARKQQASEVESLRESGNDYYKLTQTVIDSLDKEVHRNNTKIENLLKGIPSSEILIQPNANSFFIAHKEKDEYDALLTITKMEVENKDILFKRWSKTIPGMYYNISTASSTSDFQRLFPMGLPDSEFIQFEVVGDKLLIIYLLQMCMIDINSGKLIWKTTL